jgi:hypothetical protein
MCALNFADPELIQMRINEGKGIWVVYKPNLVVHTGPRVLCSRTMTSPSTVVLGQNLRLVIYNSDYFCCTK